MSNPRKPDGMVRRSACVLKVGLSLAQCIDYELTLKRRLQSTNLESWHVVVRDATFENAIDILHEWPEANLIDISNEIGRPLEEVSYGILKIACALRADLPSKVRWVALSKDLR